jgi:hypothetical protein
MLTPDEILSAGARKWPSVLRAEARGENLFPLRIPFGRPVPTADFEVLRRDIELIAAAPPYWRITWEEIETRKWGRQRLPVRLEFASAEELARALGRSDELLAFRAALLAARTECPTLEPWLRDSAHRIVEHLNGWDRLIAVCSFFQLNPRPQCYMRQLPVSVETKFIEENAGILRELLDFVVGDAVDTTAATFAERFNLLVDPPRVRFRFLDESLRNATAWPVPDCSVPVPSFAKQPWSIPQVLIVENRDIFLSLPGIADTLAVFGSGKALALLKSCQWMERSRVIYWGDCDEAGYGILSGLRSAFPHVRSILMDECSWHKWGHLATLGRRDLTVQHDHLTETERAALTLVLAGPWMLEQEKIPWLEAERAIHDAISG